MSLPIYQRVAVTDAGDVIPGAEYTVINENTGVAAPIYSDRTGATLLTAPYFADSAGTIQFYIAQGTTFRVAASGGVGTYTDRYVYGVAEAVLVQADGNVSFADNQKVTFGAGSDLQIYHDGSNSYIDDAGTGDLRLRGSAVTRIQSYAGEDMVVAVTNGAVNLYHNNAKKLETTSTGIDVTGTVTADGLVVSGNSYIGSGNTFTDPTSGYFFAGNGQYTNGIYGVGVNNVAIAAGGSERMRIDSAGNVMFGKSDSNPAVAGFVIGSPTAGVTASGASSLNNTYHAYKTGEGAGYKFYVSYAGTVNYTALSQLSDEREKKNIVDIPHGLNAIMSLKPRCFDWNGDEEANGVFGFIAQEVETVLPSLIGEYKKDEGVTRKSLSQVELIPVLTKAIQEQQALIEALTARIEALEAK